MAAGVVRATLWLLLPVLILQVFDRAVPAARAGDVLPLAVAVVVAFALRSGLDLATELMADSLQRVRNRLTDWQAIQALFGGEAGSGDTVPEGTYGSAGLRLPFICRLAGIPVLLTALIYLGGVMAVPAVVLALIAGLTAGVIHRRPSMDGAAQAQSLAAGILDAVWTLKAMGAEQLALRMAEDEHRKNSSAGKVVSGQIVSTSRIAAVFDRATVLLVVLLGCILTLNELLTLGQFVSSVVIAMVLVRDAYWGAAGWALSRVGGGRGLTGAEGQAGEQDVPQEPLPRVTGNLMINRVSMEEPANRLRAVSRTLFDRIRIEVDAGETVLVKGGDVHMQSALLRLMAGLEKPASGTVSVDGYDLSAFRPDSIRRQVAYVPTLSQVIPGTLMENLTGFDAGKVADAMGAARLTGLDGKAASLTDGFDTKLEDGALGFPTGFRQHLAITRALAFKPRVLLLDHATENLDSQDVRAFADVLGRLKGRVTIVYTSTQAGLRAMAGREIDLDSLSPAPEIGPELADDGSENDVPEEAAQPNNEQAKGEEG